MSSAVHCRATTAAGHPCSRIATHQHITDLGTRVMVCSQHLKVLTRRERGKSDEEILEGWGVTAPTPSPGQTTPLGSPSPPLAVDG